MIIARIEGCTRVLGAPRGWTPETSGECLGLPIRDEMNGDVPCMVSAWEPTPAELAAIAAGGKVLLRVLGTSHPPVMLLAADPVDVAAEAHDEAQRVASPHPRAASEPVASPEDPRDFLLHLRQVNAARLAAWEGDNPASALFHAVELGGEAGEVLNVAKKLHREAMGWRGSRASVVDLADELADVIICVDKMAIGYGVDLAEAVARKFNATSEKNGFPHRLSVTSATGPEA